MRIEREREDGAIRYRWVIGPCGDPYCRQDGPPAQHPVIVEILEALEDK